MAERKLDPRGPNKFEPTKRAPFPDQANYPEEPGRKRKKPKVPPPPDKKP